MTQEKALELLKSGNNVFLTGIAGAGKTFVVMQFIQFLQEQNIPYSVTASTGIVAAAIDGVTIHSFSGMGIKTEMSQDDFKRLKKSEKISSRIKGIKVLIIDEISMLSSNQIDIVDMIFRYIRGNNFEPFGGVQVVFVGDFLQLPPVRGSFAFKSLAWEQAQLKICYLDKPYRQKDEELLTILNAIRSNSVSDEVKKMLRARVKKSVKNTVTLFTHNADVDIFNTLELEKIDSPVFVYKMWVSGVREIAETIKRNVLSPEILELKKGARVMVTKNMFDEGLVNGTIATVTELNDSSVTIKTNDDLVVDLGYEKWSYTNPFGRPIASVHQVPLRLAYAITVHKSQGMTLSAAVMNLSKVFEPGQGYVALSRLGSLKNLSLEDDVSEETFLINQECFAYEKELIEKSNLL